MDLSRKYLYLSATIVIVVVHMTAVYGTGMAPLPAGKRQPCADEGAIVRLGYQIDMQNCFSCTCKNGYVECNNNCPRIDDCPVIVQDNCCKRCKGCSYKNRYYESHTEWSEPGNPCTVFRCEAGVITRSELQCQTLCMNPLPPEPGKCCPTCPECRINGQIAAEDRDVISDDDPCLKCRCNNGKLLCTKKACPVLQCPLSKQHKPYRECCSKCKGKGNTDLSKPLTCVLQHHFMHDSEKISLDKCTECTCQNNTNICRRTTCPIVDCAPEEQHFISSHCCPICKKLSMAPIGSYQSRCRFEGKDYEEGQEWPMDICGSCKCNDGKVRCVRTQCNTTCPSGHKKIKLPQECCPKCVEVEGVCMAFGDPHYKSFDGKIYTFKGIGKYQLTKDCEQNTFSVKVANLLANNSTTTKRVAINFGDVRLNLQQRCRVKYNGKKIGLPYKKEGKFRVNKVRDMVEVVLQNDVKLLWNGRGFLEVTVPPTYKNKLCGMCGNFNGNVLDEFQTRDGEQVGDKDLLSFGSSWCVGNKTQCAKKIKANKSPCLTVNRTHRCQYFRTGDIFSACEPKLSFSKYYKACKLDMCTCPHDKCYCESLMAYARECERLGVRLPEWQKSTGCDSHHSRRITNHQRKKHQKQFSAKAVRISEIRQKSLRSPIPIQ